MTLLLACGFYPNGRQSGVDIAGRGVVPSTAVRGKGCRRSRFLRSGHAYAEIRELLAGIEPKGRCLDLPSGRGVNLAGIRAAGFEPVAADTGGALVRLDFTDPLPFADGSFAAALCSEGIEHHPAQPRLIREFARVLAPGGALLLTTPNVLNLRARWAHLLSGHYSLRRAPISEATGIWNPGDERRPHVGHVHLIGYFELRFILAQAGFRIARVTTAKYARSAALLAPFLWPPVQLATRRLYRRHLGGDTRLRREILAHALSPDLLFGQKLIVAARKIDGAGEKRGLRLAEKRS